MVRTKQTSRKSTGGKAPSKQLTAKSSAARKQPSVRVLFYGFRVDCFLTTCTGSWWHEEASQVPLGYRRLGRDPSDVPFARTDFRFSAEMALQEAAEAYMVSKTGTLLRSMPSA